MITNAKKQEIIQLKQLTKEAITNLDNTRSAGEYMIIAQIFKITKYLTVKGNQYLIISLVDNTGFLPTVYAFNKSNDISIYNLQTNDIIQADLKYDEKFYNLINHNRSKILNPPYVY